MNKLISYTFIGEFMKKFFQVIGILTLMVGSFVYTEKVGTTAKLSDTLLTEIKSKKDGYKENAIEPIIKEDTIIPGINGKEVDVDKSYEAMSKIGYFDDKLLVYKPLKVEKTLDKNKDKYVINGNNTKMDITLLFKVDTNDDITNIIKALESKKAKGTFFIGSKYLEKHHNQIIKLVQNGHTVGNLSNNEDYEESDFVWMKTIITNIGSQIYNYCYTEKPNKKILKICNIQNSITIMPQIIIKKNAFINIKKNLLPGAIISLDVNNSLNKEIEAILNYITSKGYNIKSLEELLKE